MLINIKPLVVTRFTSKHASGRLGGVEEGAEVVGGGEGLQPLQPLLYVPFQIEMFEQQSPGTFTALGIA